MSSMLDQAIVDAKALKEAAIKSAESTIIEKYSQEIREAVDTMLNQEEVINEEEGDMVRRGTRKGETYLCRYCCGQQLDPGVGLSCLFYLL